MDRPIQVGDLVQVVRAQRCGCTHSLGTIFVVHHIAGGPNKCSHCGTKFAESMDAWENGARYAAQVMTLKRIPPLDELEVAKTDETIKETA